MGLFLTPPLATYVVYELSQSFYDLQKQTNRAISKSVVEDIMDKVPESITENYF